MYKHLIKSLFTIVEKLDLRTEKRVFKDNDGNDQEIYFCDPNIDLNPVRPKDFHIFLNLVDFYMRLLRYKLELTENFEEWVPMYFELMIRKTVQYPLVSGFVKLIELGVAIADRFDYFEDNFLYDRNITFGFVTYFLEFMIAKGQKVTGELQIACLKFVLSSPVSLLNHFIGTNSGLVDIFVTAFGIGKDGLLWLANAGKFNKKNIFTI
jgi:DNA-dependent protein kinase catalytic subunit